MNNCMNPPYLTEREHMLLRAVARSWKSGRCDTYHELARVTCGRVSSGFSARVWRLIGKGLLVAETKPAKHGDEAVVPGTLRLTRMGRALMNAYDLMTNWCSELAAGKEGLAL